MVLIPMPSFKSKEESLRASDLIFLVMMVSDLEYFVYSHSVQHKIDLGELIDIFAEPL